MRASCFQLDGLIHHLCLGHDHLCSSASRLSDAWYGVFLVAVDGPKSWTGGRSDQGAVCDGSCKQKSSQPPKFTSKFEGYRDILIHAKKRNISSLFSLQVIPIHCLGSFVERHSPPPMNNSKSFSPKWVILMPKLPLHQNHTAKFGSNQRWWSTS